MERIKEILSTMAVPETRKELTLSNVRWLSRNAGVRNRDHADLRELFKLLRQAEKSLA